MRTDLHLKTQAELVADCQAFLNDTGISLASATQYKEAVNYAIRMWAGRVVVPSMYVLSFAAGVYDFALPRYIKPPFVIEILTSSSGLYYGGPVGNSSSDLSYQRITNYTVMPDGADGFTLRLGSIPYAQTGHITYWSENTVLPTGSPTLTSTIQSSDTSATITLANMPELNDNGFAKIETEWVAYNGLSRTATGFVVSNLVRAFYETTAISHTSTTAVSFGVGVDKPSLWNQLYNQVAAYVHQLNVQKSTGEDGTRHQQLMSYHQQVADSWWRNTGYVGQRKTKVVLSSGALGPLLW